jgi:membrane protein YqaA with SNARE-associated domain
MLDARSTTFMPSTMPRFSITLAKMRHLCARAIVLLRSGKRPARGYASALQHFGAFGIFAVSVVDSSPVPTFGGPDILVAILAGTHREPWYYYAATAAVGSAIGAYITFRAARRAGSGYLSSKFARRTISRLGGYFEKWGTGALTVSTVVPLPFPTSAFFAAAGASDYPARTFVAVVLLGRTLRYSIIAALAALYGRDVIRGLRHPRPYFAWLLLIAGVTSLVIAATRYLQNRISKTHHENPDQVTLPRSIGMSFIEGSAAYRFRCDFLSRPDKKLKLGK